MRLPFKIAFRYFFSKKSTAAINVLNWITVSAIAVGTAALIIVLSVFNGFETLVISLYHSFNSDLQVQPIHGKTFLVNEVQWKKISELKGVRAVSKCVEENALLRFHNQQFIATIQGVDEHFSEVSDVSKNIYKGNFHIATDTIFNKTKNENVVQYNLVAGAGVAQSLGISADLMNEPMQIFIPNRKTENISVDLFDAFRSLQVFSAGTFAIQQDFDTKYCFMDFYLLKDLLQYNNEISLLNISLKSSSDEDFVKNNLKSILGKDVEIKNRYEQNSFIYRIMKIEKWIVFSILTFILIIASFNMIGSLSMVAIDKKRDISVLQTLGANATMIKQIFLLEGLIAASIGTLLGLFFGTLICAGQKYFHWLKLGGNSFVIDDYPVDLQALDFVRVIIVMMLIGIATSWFPAQRAAQQTWDLKSR